MSTVYWKMITGLADTLLEDEKIDDSTAKRMYDLAQYLETVYLTEKGKA